MKKIAALSLAMLICLSVAAPMAVAGGKTVTLEGNIVCAKCKLGEEGRDMCQNVLVVEKKGKEKLYYLSSNDTNTTYGDVCMKTDPVRVTGTVTKEDGKMWVAATEIERLQKDG